MIRSKIWQKKNEILIYEDKDGVTKVNVKFTEEDILLTKYQIAEIYKTTRQNIDHYNLDMIIAKENIMIERQNDNIFA